MNTKSTLSMTVKAGSGKIINSENEVGGFNDVFSRVSQSAPGFYLLSQELFSRQKVLLKCK